VIKALIFDMDGVLVDSMPDHADAWIEVFAQEGIHIKRQDIYEIEGSNHVGIVTLVFQKAGRMPPTDFSELARRKRDIFDRINTVKAFDGLREKLEAMKGRYRFAVVSGSDREIVASLVGRFYPGIFDAMVSGNDVKHGKPSPEPYLKAVDMLGVRNDECIVVENAPMGVESAKNAGIYCVAIPTYVDSHKLEWADTILENHAKLLEYLNTFS
jgi:HAD superfamily hydrolase (TIGR01509 family)